MQKNNDRRVAQARTDGGVGHDDHHVGVGREEVDERRKLIVAHLHALEVCCRFAAL